MEYNIPKTMRAMVLTSPGKWELQDVPVPEPGPGEVLCRIGGVAICGSDPEIVRGGLAGIWPTAYPFIAGHEWAGRVVKLGPDVQQLSVGQRVAGEAHKGCGQCRNCLEGRYTICLNYGKPETGHRHYGFITNGAYAQYAVYQQSVCTPLADSISYKEAAMCDTAGVALHGIERCGVRPGCTVAIIGPGPIGMMGMKLVKALGASRIIVVGRGSRLASAGRMGADELVDFTKTDPVAAVRELTGGVGADICLECSGAKGTIDQGIRMVTKGGGVVMLGVPTNGDITEEIPFKYTTHNEITIYGSRANPNCSAKVLSLIAGGNIHVAEMVTHTFDLEHIGDAFDTFIGRKDHVMKVVIYPNGGEEA